MKKEAVSVLKPHKSKSSKNGVDQKPKKKGLKIEKDVVVSEPRVKQKAKIIAEQKVDYRVTLKTLKGLKSLKPEILNRPKIVKIEHISGVDSKLNKSDDDKMAIVQKNPKETRVQLKKKSKAESEEAIEPLKKLKKIDEIEAESKTPEIKVEAKTKSKNKKKSKVMSRKSIENVGDLKMTKAHVRQSIQAVQQLALKQSKLKNSLLSNESDPILLQVECIKIAKTPRRNIRPFLPHQLAGPLDDVALFVPDLQIGRGRDYENTVDHWENILREKGVDCIKEIIPINRVKTEFSQFELQRKLAKSFDYFLCDGRIVGHLNHLLGKAFLQRKGPPTPLKLKRDDLKAEMNFALHKTCMEVHPYGNSHTMPIGTLSMDAKKLAENVWAACETLKEEYPGGWDNIRSIRIKPGLGAAIPIYMNLVSKNNVPIPIIKPKRPRAYETVEGELTTVPGGALVKVTPEGRVHVKRLKDYGEPKEKEEDADEEEE